MALPAVAFALECWVAETEHQMDLFHGSPNRSQHPFLNFDELSELNQTLIALYTYLHHAYQNMHIHYLCWFSSNGNKGNRLLLEKGECKIIRIFFFEK